MDKAIVTKTRRGSISEGIMEGFVGMGLDVSSFPYHIDVRDIDQEGTELFSGEEKVFANCVGITDNAKPSEWTYERANQLLSTNLTAAIAMTSEFVRKTQGTPGVKTIFHVGSLWSRKHATNGAVYTASKAGLAHYVSCVAKDLDIAYPGEYVVIGVHPGNVQGTPLTQEVQEALADNRGFSQEEIDNLYEGTITPLEIGNIVSDMVGNIWLSGENIYLGNNDKR